MERNSYYYELINNYMQSFNIEYKKKIVLRSKINYQNRQLFNITSSTNFINKTL